MKNFARTGRRGTPVPAVLLLAILAGAALFVQPAPLYAQSPSADSIPASNAWQTAAADQESDAAPSLPSAPLEDTMLRIGELSAAAPDEENFGRLNLREASIDGLRDHQWRDRDDAPGVRIGSFILRPTISQSISVESDRSGGSRDNRTYWQTGIGGTLTSDWSRHELSVIGGGEWQKNISGEGETEPEVDIGADLRLDLANETTAHVTGGYQFYREDTDDPNAISDASTQSGVNQFSGGLTIEHDFGRLRGTAGLALDRTVYSDATLSDGTRLSMKDRDQTAGQLRGRVGYEISPALIPFIEAYAGRAIYDDEYDTLGFARSSHSYGGRGGVEIDLGEKLRGEFGLGYERVTYQDERLDPIGAITIDSSFAWSPRRGTDVALGFATSVNPLTDADESGYVDYTATSLLSHEVRHNLLARLSGAATWRRFPSDSVYDDQTIYATTAGLTWGLNRYLDLTGDIGYEYTDNKESADSQILRAGIGLSLKR